MFIFYDILITIKRKETILMKNTSRIMFNVGNIVTIVYLGLGALLSLIGLIIIIVGAVGGEPSVTAAGGSTLGWGIYFIVSSILCLIFVGKAKRELADESTKNNTPFIITIVFGAIASNPFYVLAGIFGLIAESQQGNQQPKEVEEKPAEEPKEE